MTIFTPTDLAPSEIGTATLPEPESLIRTADRKRVTSGATDFVKIHPRTLEIVGGIRCDTHQVWDFGCKHCLRAIERRSARRSEQLAQAIRGMARTGRYGRSSDRPTAGVALSGRSGLVAR